MWAPSSKGVFFGNTKIIKLKNCLKDGPCEKVIGILDFETNLKWHNF